MGIISHKFHRWTRITRIILPRRHKSTKTWRKNINHKKAQKLTTDCTDCTDYFSHEYLWHKLTRISTKKISHRLRRLHRICFWLGWCSRQRSSSSLRDCGNLCRRPQSREDGFFIKPANFVSRISYLAG